MRYSDLIIASILDEVSSPHINVFMMRPQCRASWNEFIIQITS